MNTLALLDLMVSAQEALPPPPEPTGSPEIDTVRVIGVVLVSLGIIVLLALALRPLVVRTGKSPAPADPTDERFSDDEPDLFASPGSGSIIQFPKAATVETVAQPPAWVYSDSTVADRFHRVVGEGNRRRKLGDWQPDRTPHDLAAAALHRDSPEAADRRSTASKEHSGTIVPWRGAANGTDGRPFLGPLTGAPAGRSSMSTRSMLANDSSGGLAAESTVEMPGTGPARDSIELGADRAPTESATVAEVDAPEGAAQLGGAARGDAAMEHATADDVRAAAVLLNGHSSAEPPPSFLFDIPFGEATENASVRVDPTAKQTDELVLPAGLEAGMGVEATELDENEIQQAPAEAEPTAMASEIDTPTLAELHQVVRELIYCANSGQLLHGFALYSDPFLFRFMDGSGMTEEEFRYTYDSVGARPRDEWDHLDHLSDVVRRQDCRIEATACYVDGAGKPSNGIERYCFVLVDGAWQIDDITPVEATA